MPKENARKSRKRGPGRPALAEKDQKTSFVRFRVTEAELKKLKNAAARAKRVVSDWVRLTALQAADEDAERGD
jgi:hypothetical protein